MIQITIDEELKSICPNLRLGVIECNVKLRKDNPDLWNKINETIGELEEELTAEKIRELPGIESSMNAYRSIGKDPNRYRLSAEALLRRIVNGKGLYKINNVVDLLNLVSIKTGFSIGGYNADKIEGSIQFGIGKADEDYEGIGRGKLNIEKLPVFRDKKGAFGSPTSDSIRTQIDDSCENFLMVIIDFQANNELNEAMNLACDLLDNFADAQNINTHIV
jgi:DNA/RNA-binding domain of Phe-tRNA-synthetase-like protein